MKVAFYSRGTIHPFGRLVKVDIEGKKTKIAMTATNNEYVDFEFMKKISKKDEELWNTIIQLQEKVLTEQEFLDYLRDEFRLKGYDVCLVNKNDTTTL